MADIIFRIRTDDKGNPAIERMSKNVSKVNKKLKNTSGILKSLLQAKAITSSLLVVRNGVSEVVDEYVKWEKSMRGIEAIAGVTGDNLNAFMATSRKIATETEHSASKIGDAMLEISKMGFSPQGTLEAIAPIVDLATASMTDLRYTALNTITVLKSFNMDPVEASVMRVADSVAIALNKTSLDFESLMESMKFVAPVANQMNVDLEETLELLGALADVGLRGSLGGTSLKNILLNLMKPSDRVKQALDELGVAGKDVSEILMNMKDKNLTILDFLETFDKRAVTGAVALSGMRERILELRESLDSSEGAVEKMAGIMRDSLSAELGNAMNLINELGFSLLDAFAPHILAGIHYLQSILKDLVGWLKENKDNLVKLVGVIVKTTVGVVKLAGAFLGGESALLKLSAATVAYLAIMNITKISQFGAALRLLAVDFAYLKTAIGVTALDFKTLLLSINPVVVAIIAASTAFALFMSYVDKLSKKASEMEKWAGTGGQQSEAHKKELEAILDLHEKIADAKQKSADIDLNIDPLGNVDQKALDRLSELGKVIKSSKKDLESAIKKFKIGENTYLYDLFKDAEKAQRYYDNLTTTVEHLGDVQSEADKQAADAKKELAELTKRYGDILADIFKQQEDSSTKLTSSLKKNTWELELDLALMKEMYNEIYNRDPAMGGRLFDYDYDMPYGSDFYEPQGSLDETQYGRVDLDAQIAAAEKEAALLDEQLKALEDAAQAAEEYKQLLSDIMDTVSMYSDLALKVTDIFSNMHEVRMNLIKAEFDERINSATAWYNVETRLSEEGSLRRIVAEHKYAQEMEKIESEKEERARKAAETEKRLAALRAQINTGVAVTAALTDVTMPTPMRIAQAIVVGLLGAAETAAIMTANYRFGTPYSGVVTGNGNGTSDSVTARLSKGEVVMSNNDVQKAGGYNAIQQFIDRGTGYRSESPVNVYISTYVGTREYTREMIPEIKKELTRW